MDNVSRNEGYAVKCMCGKCGHSEVFYPATIVLGQGIYSSDIDFCTKCGEMWKPEEDNDGETQEDLAESNKTL